MLLLKRPVVRFGLAVILLLTAVYLLAQPDSGLLPGARVFNHNLENNRDATGLFYTELDNYWDLERGLLAERQGDTR